MYNPKQQTYGKVEYDTLRAELANAKKTIERAASYIGVEGYGCPLCKYDNGRFVALCSMHEQLAEARKESAAKSVYRELVYELCLVVDYACPYLRPIVFDDLKDVVQVAFGIARQNGLFEALKGEQK